MFNPTRSLQSTQSLPIPISTPLSPPDESTHPTTHDDIERHNGGWVQTYGQHKRNSYSMSGMEGNELMGLPESDPPRTVERKRRGRMNDMISFLPTPPRTKDTRLDPTPTQPPTSTSSNSSSKRRVKATTTTSTTVSFPTPTSDEIITLDPTFSYNSDESVVKMNGNGMGLGRRRPGLTFAQQMAAAASASTVVGSSTDLTNTNTNTNNITTSTAGETKIHRVGVGMGGYRLHPFMMREDISSSLFMSGKKKLLGPPAPIEDVDGGNPFLKMASSSSSSSSLNGMDVEGVVDDLEMGVEVGNGNGNGKGLGFGLGLGLGLGSPLSTDVKGCSMLDTPPNSTIKITSPPPRGVIEKQSTRTATKVGKKWAPPIVGVEEGNPFLSSNKGMKKGSKEGSREEDWEEKETVDYVFRGTKTTFANPYYKVSTGETSSSLLPTSHPDFSPPPAPRPRLLWPSRDEEDDVDMDNDDDRINGSSKPRLLFAPTNGVKRRAEEDEEMEGKKLKHRSMNSGTFEMGGGGLRM